MSEGLGACLGPLLGVALFQVSFQWISLVASTIFFVLTLLQLLYLPQREQCDTAAPRPVLDEWREVLANRTFVIFAVGMVAYLTLYNQLYLSLPLEVRHSTGNDGATGILFMISALLSIMVQVHVTAYVKARWRPLQAITLGLVLMGVAFVPMLLDSSFLPLNASQTKTTVTFLVQTLNLSPAILSVVLLSLGTMTLQPFVLSLIPALGGGRLLGTYFGFYYLVQGVGVMIGNLAIGMAFDLQQASSLTSVWLLLVGLGLASAFSIAALDSRSKLDQDRFWRSTKPDVISHRLKKQVGKVVYCRCQIALSRARKTVSDPASSAKSAWASCRSGLSNPSVNQAYVCVKSSRAASP